MKCSIQITLTEAKRGRLAMLELAEIMTKLTAQVLRSGVVMPITITADGAVVASFTMGSSHDLLKIVR